MVGGSGFRIRDSGLVCNVDGAEAIVAVNESGGEPRRGWVVEEGLALGEEVTVGDLRDAVFWSVETSGPDDADLGAVEISHQFGAFLIGDGDDLGGGIRHGDNQVW
jgi:hypothetical protein